MKNKIRLMVIATLLSVQGCQQSATHENQNATPSPTTTRSAAPSPAAQAPPTATADKWEFYEDAAGKWRWRRTAPNGKIVGASSEGYNNRSDCVDNAKRNGYTGS